MSLSTIVQDAKQAAIDESTHQFNKMGQQDSFPCGFAWVDVKVSRINSKDAKELLALGFSKSHIPKTLYMWNPGQLSVQNVDVKYAGARAMAAKLTAAGLTAYADSRLD
jgi:hypothetical protein